MTHSTPKLLGRRAALRLIAGTAAVVGVGASMRPDAASAARVWCRADPTFRVDGLVGNVYVSGLLDRVYDTTGPIQLTFTAPVGCDVELLASDDGFGYGYDIRIEHDAKLKNDGKRIGLEIAVHVPATSDKLPILVEFVPDGTITVADKKSDATNRTIVVKTELERPSAKTS